jgi:hypothetical protein
MFLFINATGIFGEVFVRGSLLSGDATQVAQNIISSERLYRLSILSDVVMLTGVLVLIWALYVLLRPVNRDLALLAVLLRMVEIAVSVAATVASLIAVRLLTSAEYLSLFEAGELHALSRLARNAFGFGLDVGFIFVGLGSSVFAYLLLRSQYIPRMLARWGVLASVLFATYHLVIIAFPGAAKTLMYVAFAPMGIYEISIGLWLLMKGVKIPASAPSAA